jgi:hypothetical protein
MGVPPMVEGRVAMIALPFYAYEHSISCLIFNGLRKFPQEKQASPLTPDPSTNFSITNTPSRSDSRQPFGLGGIRVA